MRQKIYSKLIEEIFFEIGKTIYRLKGHRMFQEKLITVRELLKSSLSYWTLKQTENSSGI